MEASGWMKIIETATDVGISISEQKHLLKLQNQLSARQYASDLERLAIEQELAELQLKQQFALDILRNSKKTNNTQLIRNIAIGFSVFVILGIGFYYAVRR